VEDEDGEAAPGRDGFDPKGRPRGPKDAGGNR
ncbi:MAG: ribosome maturation factor RimM, partial [Mesorhizobium sp.]